MVKICELRCGLSEFMNIPVSTFSVEVVKLSKHTSVHLRSQSTQVITNVC